jgi:hypothetical protein
VRIDGIQVAHDEEASSRPNRSSYLLSPTVQFCMMVIHPMEAVRAD